MIFNSKDKKRKSGIYKITNMINNKIYIGSAVDFYDRFSHHRKRLRGGYHSNTHLQRSFDKYGENNFIFEIIEIVEDKSMLLDREQYWLDYTKCYDRNIGYNIAKNARSPMLGVKLSDEQKKRISEIHKGKSLSDEHKKKMSESQKGIKKSDRQREIMHQASKNYWSNDENKEKQSKRMKSAHKDNPELRNHLINYNKNRIVTEKERQSISERKRGSNHHNAKLDEEKVREIKIMLRDGINRKIIADKFDVSIYVISKIATGYRWGHVEI